MFNIVNPLNAIDYNRLDKFQKKDYEGQLKAAPVLSNLFSKYEDVTMEHHITDRGRIDIFLIVKHKGIEHKYAIECKDRDFTSETFDTCMLNPDKWGWLMAYKKLGFKPLFLNTFTDNKYMIWDVSTSDWDVGMVEVPIYSVDKSKGTTIEPRFFLPTESCINQGDLIVS